MKGGESEDCAQKKTEKKASKDKSVEGFPISFTYVEKEEDELLWKKMRIEAKKRYMDRHYPLAKSGPGWCRAQVSLSRWKPRKNKFTQKDIEDAEADLKEVYEILATTGFRNSPEEVEAELDRTFPERERKNQEIENERKEKKCPGCGKDWKFRCSGCFIEVYCGKICQTKMWKEGHKTNCKETRKEFKKVILYPVPRSKEDVEKDNIEKRIKEVLARPEKKELSKTKFFIKVVLANNSNPESPILVTNEDYTVFGGFWRLGQEEMFDKLKKSVKEKGVKSRETGEWGEMKEAFFFSIHKGVSEQGLIVLEINPLRVQPRELW